MYIICPRCSTNFVIDASHIGKNGRKARCSKCKHVWFVAPENKGKDVSKKQSINNKKPITAETKFYDGNARLLPAVITTDNKKDSNFCFYKTILIFLGLFLILLFDIVDFGQFKFSNDFSVSDINATSLDSNRIKVSCKIYNNTSKTMDLPIIRFRFYNKQSKIIERKLVENKLIKLEPKQSIDITKEFNTRAANVDVTLGSKLDFILRY